MAGKQTSAIDWDELRSQMAQIEAKLLHDFEPTEEVQLSILQQRAQLMAQRQDAPRAVKYLEVVEFELAGERYAFETAFIREVHPLRELTPLPGAPAHLLGAINIRGQILNVLDIRSFFKLPISGRTDQDKVIVLSDDGMEFCVQADRILSVLMLPETDIQLSATLLPGNGAEYLHGITSDRLMVLDARKFMRSPAIVLNEEVDN